MISIQEYFETVKYKITEGSDYGWECYGPNSYQLSSWNGVHGTGGWSANIVFSTKSQKVYEVAVCDYTNNRAYRLINPKFVEKHNKEARQRSESDKQAWDDVEYIDLDVDADFLEKARAIIAGQDYDTRVQMQVDFTNEELLKYMTMAHEQDITLNQFIENALRDFIEAHKKEIDERTD